MYIYIYLFVYIYIHIFTYAYIYTHHIDSYCCLHPHYISFYPSWLMILYRLGDYHGWYQPVEWNDVAGFNAVYIYIHICWWQILILQLIQTVLLKAVRKSFATSRVCDVNGAHWAKAWLLDWVNSKVNRGLVQLIMWLFAISMGIYQVWLTIITVNIFSLLLNTLLTTKHHKPWLAIINLYWPL